MPYGMWLGFRACVFGFVMASMLVSGTVFGQGPQQGAASAQTADAQRHFDRGLAAVQVDKWAEAREEFAAAYKLSPQLKYLAALIKADMTTGHRREAAQHLATLLRRKAELDEKTLTEARTMLAEAKAKLGTAKIHVDIDGAEVFVDGASIGRSPIDGEVFVDPGQRTFEAKKEGFASARIVLDVKPGSEPEVVLELRKIGSGVSWPLNKKLLYTGIGVTGGLAFVGVLGIVSNNLLFSAADDRHDNIGCAGTSDCMQKFGELEDTRVGLNYVAVVAGVGAGVVGGATLIYALATKKKTHGGTVPRAAVMVGPGGGTLVFTGRF